MHKNFIYQITSQQIKILIGNKKKKNERTYVFDFFPLLHSAISCRKPGNNVQSLLETSKFALKSSQEISGAERRFVPGGKPRRCKWAQNQLLPTPLPMQPCNPRQPEIPPRNHMENSTRSGLLIQVLQSNFRLPPSEKKSQKTYVLICKKTQKSDLVWAGTK